MKTKFIKPSYYGKAFNKLIDSKFTEEQLITINEFQCWKYLFRYKEKNGSEDLIKCSYYLNELIKLYKKQENADLPN